MFRKTVDESVKRDNLQNVNNSTATEIAAFLDQIIADDVHQSHCAYRNSFRPWRRLARSEAKREAIYLEDVKNAAPCNCIVSRAKALREKL